MTEKSSARYAVALTAFVTMMMMAITPAVPAEDPTGPTVRILLYSGREDPEFALEEGGPALQALRTAIEAAPEAQFEGETVIPSVLGYKGILVRSPQGAGGLPETVAIYRGNVEVRDGATRFLVDDGRALERSLLTLAVERDLVPAELLRIEKLLIEQEEPEGEEPEEPEE